MFLPHLQEIHLLKKVFLSSNKDIAKNSISSILNSELIPNNVKEDIFYQDTDYSLDFFIGIIGSF